MKQIIITILAVVSFSGCSDSSVSSKPNNGIYPPVHLLEVCVDGLVAYRGYFEYPAMYKRDKNDKLVPCDYKKYKD